jgi:hypothetical protein
MVEILKRLPSVRRVYKIVGYRTRSHLLNLSLPYGYLMTF